MNLLPYPNSQHQSPANLQKNPLHPFHTQPFTFLQRKSDPFLGSYTLTISTPNRKNLTQSSTRRPLCGFRTRTYAGLPVVSVIMKINTLLKQIKNYQVTLNPIIDCNMLMISPYLSTSVSNLPNSMNLSSGVYKYPQSHMYMRHNTPSLFCLFLNHFSNNQLHSMANNNSANDLLLRETEPLDFDDEPAPELDRALSLTLAGKLLAINRPSLSNMTFFASRTWDCPNRLSVFDHGKGLYSFQFLVDEDVLKVVKGGPWYIDGKLLVIQRVNPNLSINNLPFDSTKLWARVYDLPPKAFNNKYAKALGDILGGFCESDLQLESGENQQPTTSRLPTVRKFMRIKALIDLKVPLKRFQNIRIRNPISNKVEEIIVRFAYERLSLFCFRCGLLGHDTEKCKEEGPLLYGEWIKAERFYRHQNENLEHVPTLVEPPHPQNNQVSAAPEIPIVDPNPITLDPSIILANFRDYRANGPLPPVPPTVDGPLFGSFSQALMTMEVGCSSKSSNQLNEAVVSSDFVIPLASAPIATDVENGESQSVVNRGLSLSSILGPLPQHQTQSMSALPPIHPNHIVNTKTFEPSYFNPHIPNSDLFSPTTQRCLFKSELVHPALAYQPRALSVSPPNLSPIGANPPALIAPAVILDKTDKETTTGGNSKSKTSSRSKRPLAPSSSKGVDTPRPKRGRPASGTPKNA